METKNQNEVVQETPKANLKKKRFKKVLLGMLVLYCIVDFRLLLLIPNIILYYVPAKVQDEQRCMQLNLFGRLTVGNDPVYTRISNINISKDVIPAGWAFEQNYDRSGVYQGFKFDGIYNFNNPILSLDWLYSGLAGGLSGGTQIIHRHDRLTKEIWLNDYVDLDCPGWYFLKFQYHDTRLTPDPNWASFYLLRIPENPISKFIKQVLCAIMLNTPQDSLRISGVKTLGYEPTRFSAKILANYYCKTGELYQQNKSDFLYLTSLFWAEKGIVRNPQSPYIFLQKSQDDNKSAIQSLANSYFWSNLFRIYFSKQSLEDAESQLKKHLELLYFHTSPEQQKELKKHLGKLQEFQYRFVDQSDLENKNALADFVLETISELEKNKGNKQ